MPFAGYTDFADCVSKNKDKGNPEAYCSSIHKKATGKWPTEKEIFETHKEALKGDQLPPPITDPMPEPTPQAKYKIQVPYFKDSKWVDVEEAVDEEDAQRVYYKLKGAGKRPRIVNMADEIMMEMMKKEMSQDEYDKMKKMLDFRKGVGKEDTDYAKGTNQGNPIQVELGADSREELEAELRDQTAKKMYRKGWNELDDRQRQTIITLMKTLPRKEAKVWSKSMKRWFIDKGNSYVDVKTGKEYPAISFPTGDLWDEETPQAGKEDVAFGSDTRKAILDLYHHGASVGDIANRLRLEYDDVFDVVHEKECAKETFNIRAKDSDMADKIHDELQKAGVDSFIYNWPSDMVTVKNDKDKIKVAQIIKKYGAWTEQTQLRSPTDFRTAGRSLGLSGVTLDNFADFMSKRFPGEQDASYIGEWAGRFKRGAEWDYSDGQSRKVLQAINPSKYSECATYESGVEDGLLDPSKLN